MWYYQINSEEDFLKKHFCTSIFDKKAQNLD